MPRNLLILAAAIGAIILTVAYFGPVDEHFRALPQPESTPNLNVETEEASAPQFDDLDAADDTKAVDQPAKEIIRSLFDADRDFRDAGLAEAERFVSANFGSDRGVLRWEPVWVDPSDIVIGDILEQDSVLDEFRISIFSDISFKATETEYKPHKANNMAVWKGVLDDGSSGEIQISLITRPDRISFVIRLRGLAGHFFITETEMPNVYVAAQADPTSRRGMTTD